MELNTINNVKTLHFQNKKSKNSSLSIFQDIHKLFTIKRIFKVEFKNDKNPNRGFHAHKNCEQIITCPYGKISFKVFDGVKSKRYIIKKNSAIYVPNHIWTETTYLNIDTILICYCSNNYFEDSYIRDFNEFMKFRGLSNKD